MFEPTPTAAAAKAGAATKSKKGSRSSPLESFRTFSYGMFGEQLDRGEGDPLLAERLKQAGYDVSPGMYRSVMITTTLVAVAVTFVIGLVLFRFLLHPPFWYGY